MTTSAEYLEAALAAQEWIKSRKLKTPILRL